MSRREYRTPDSVPTRLQIPHPHKTGVYLPVHRRPMRLPEVDYRAPDCICFVTFKVHPECLITLTGEAGKLAWESLCKEIQRIGCQAYSTCLMPDHIHLLLAPSGKGESISDIVRRVKTLICASLRQQLGMRLRWQESFYDHILRSAEKQEVEFEAIVAYIYSNPEGAGLSSNDYPFRFRYDL